MVGYTTVSRVVFSAKRMPRLGSHSCAAGSDAMVRAHWREARTSEFSGTDVRRKSPRIGRGNAWVVGGGISGDYRRGTLGQASASITGRVYDWPCINEYHSAAYALRCRETRQTHRDSRSRMAARKLRVGAGLPATVERDCLVTRAHHKQPSSVTHW